MNNEEKILLLLESMQTELQKTNERLGTLEGTVMRIENDHGRQLALLVDGHMQNAQKLDRIEAEVTRHEEIILRRVQ